MHKIITQLPELKLVGITEKTSNAQEMNAASAKISGLIQKYFKEDISNKIINRNNPHVTYCIYTEYESDFNGNYTYLIGEEVGNFKPTSSLQTITIPAQKYVKFTTLTGKMPEICINAWQMIWSMSPSELGGSRSYIADFEIYDQRALDPENAVLDIYIGIK